MKFNKLIIFSIIILLNSQLLSQNYHRLKINTILEGEFFINRTFVCKGKLLDTLLVSDNYFVEINIKGQDNVTKFKKNILLNSDTTLSLITKKELLIRSDPSNASILLDSISFGYTPNRISFFDNYNSLSISKENYLSKTFQLKDITEKELFVKLERISIEKRKSLLNLKIISATASILTGIIANYYKQQANKLFSKEHLTQDDIVRINKYDRVSAYFTIGMELSFGIFVFSLFSE